MLKDSEPYARIKSAEVLLLLDPSRKDEVIVVARALLKDKDECGSAATLLGGIGAPAKPAIPDIQNALKLAPPDGDERTAYTRVSLLQALGSIEPSRIPEVVRELTKLLEHKSGFVRSTAIAALTRCGPAAKDSLPELLKLAGSDKLTQGELYPLCVAFEAMGPSAKEAAPILRRWLVLGDEILSGRIAGTLEKIEGKK